MKKIIYIFLILLLLCGCNKKVNKKIEKEKKEVGTMLTCEEKNITYTYYYNKDEDTYYKATYLAKYKYDNEDDALLKLDELKKEWYDNFADKIMDVDFKVNDNTAFISITAFRDTDAYDYKYYFGDRYNISIDEVNKSFNDKCLIKPIKK